MSLSLYVYYKVAPTEQAALWPAVQQLQARLATLCQRLELQRRCDDAHTWMECYLGITDRAAFQQHMQAALQAIPQPWPVRHEEWFTPLDFPQQR
ncbi:DUF4936 family protein [Leeia sp.]|uniref:DUF4936 family protein n=1 Tax=Leeia sp. TaxID=2884678 RepID=UPI0035AF6972